MNTDSVYSYRIHYKRLEESRFYGHLEILQLIFRVLARAGVPVLYSQGFNPSPRVSFSQALPVGMESEAEFFDVDVSSPLTGHEDLIAKLNRELPQGIIVTGLGIKPKSELETALVSYSIALEHELTEYQKESIIQFLDRKEFIIERERKKKIRQIDIRPLVHNIAIAVKSLHMELITHQGRAGVNPRDILCEVVGLPGDDVLLARMKKQSVADFSANT